MSSNTDTKLHTLTYFDMSLNWNVETARICFEMSGVNWKDKRVLHEDLPKLRAKGALPFGQIPVLDVGDEKLTQASGILKYAARLAGMYPTDAWLAARVDETLSLLQEHFSILGAIHHTEDAQTKANMITKVVEVDLPLILARLETVLTNNAAKYPGSQYFVADSMTAADIGAANLFNFYTIQNLGFPNKVNHGPRLAELLKKMEQNETVAGWRSKHPK